MTRIPLVVALLTTAAVVTAVNAPSVGPAQGAGPQAAPTKTPTQGTQEKPRPIEPMKIDSRDLENAFYTILERDHEFNDPRWPFAIKVRDVQGKTLIDATFRFRTKGKDNESTWRFKPSAPFSASISTRKSSAPSLKTWWRFSTSSPPAAAF